MPRDVPILEILGWSLLAGIAAAAAATVVATLGSLRDAGVQDLLRQHAWRKTVMYVLSSTDAGSPPPDMSTENDGETEGSDANTSGPSEDVDEQHPLSQSRHERLKNLPGRIKPRISKKEPAPASGEGTKPGD